MYRSAATIGPQSPLQTEIAKIRTASSDPKQQASAALALVQDKIRYFLLAYNEGNLVPASADVTWTRRYGDCKGKTALLLALLHGLGIEAEPVLASVENNDGLDQRLPMIGAFDHVLVRAHIDGKAYWLDGTRTGDQRLDEIETPSFRWALPLADKTTELVKLTPERLKLPQDETIITFDATADIDTPAPTHAEMVLRGYNAVVTHKLFVSVAEATRDKAMRDIWLKQFDFVEIKTVAEKFDPATRTLTLLMDGSAKMDWSTTSNNHVRAYEVDNATVGWKANFKREPKVDKTAPFANTFPFFSRQVTRILLPTSPQKFTVVGDDVDEVVAGTRLTRKSSIKDRLFTMEATRESLTPEFSAAEAVSAGPELVRLSKVITYVYAWGDKASATGARVDAEKDRHSILSAQANHLLDKQQLDQAIPLFTQLLTEDPKRAAAWAGRGLCYVWKNDLPHAKADLAKAMAIDHDDIVVQHLRAMIASKEGDHRTAIISFTAALAQNPGDTFARDRRVDEYRSLGQYDKALDDIDAILVEQPRTFYYRMKRAVLLQESGDKTASQEEAAAALALPIGAPGENILRASLHAQMGYPREVINEVSAALAAGDTNNFSAYQLRSAAYIQLKDTEKALADTEQMLRLRPNDIDIYLQQANIYKSINKADLSIAAAKAAVDTNPTSDYAYAVYGATLAANGHRAEADVAFARAITIRPSYSTYITHARYRDPKDISGKLADLDAAEKIGPEVAKGETIDKTIYYLRAETYAMSDKPEAARKAYSEIREGAAKNANKWNNLCWSEATHHFDLEQAVKDCNRALELAPNHPAYLDSRAFAQLRLKHYGEAIADYDAALAKRPDFAASLFGRGIAKLGAGKKSEGYADLARARMLSPSVDKEYADYGILP